DVYLPNWMQSERLAYTDRLANLLGILLPEGMDGTISTVLGAFAALIGGEADVERMTLNLVRHAVHLRRIEERSGKHLSLALEPEPWRYLGRVDQTVTFFRVHLFGPRALGEVRSLSGGSVSEAEELL